MTSDKALISRPFTQPTEILTQLHSGQLLQVRGHRGSAIIICHRHHAELAGPGSAVGGIFDIDCRRAIPIGNLGLVYPDSRPDRQKAYAMRQKWMGFTQKAMESSVPLRRAQSILILVEKYFGSLVVHQLSDELLAQMVGVLPKTIEMGRQAIKTRSERQEQKSIVVSH